MTSRSVEHESVESLCEDGTGTRYRPSDELGGLVQKQGKVRPHMACCRDTELASPLRGKGDGTNAHTVLISTLPCAMRYVYLCASGMQRHHPAFASYFA
jgi:hypothetical protein